MYAIVDIAGQQFKVEKDQKIFVHRLDAKEGSKISFDKVLLTDDKGKINIGKPILEGVSVSAKILEHLKGDKVTVFKKKRRKGYRIKNGHKQMLTRVKIDNISTKSTTNKIQKSETKETSAKKTTTKKTTAKKTTAKKTTAKKTTAN